MASGDQIAEIINLMENNLEGVPRGHAIIACIALCLVLQSPTLTPDQIQHSVREVSRFICMLLEGMDVPAKDRPLPN